MGQKITAAGSTTGDKASATLHSEDQQIVPSLSTNCPDQDENPLE
jgi:hypothetical protein